MKISEFKKLIREEVSKILKEEDNFSSDILKNLQAERTAQQRKFIAWAKAQAAKQNVRLNFNGDSMVTASISKLERYNILTPELMEKWKNAPEGSAENDLWEGLSVVFTRYKIMPAM